MNGQTVQYGPPYRHNICLLQQKKYLQEFWKTSIFAGILQIHCPPNSVSQYCNYRRYHSIILQAVVDANLKFVTVDVGACGKQNNGGVSWNSAQYQSFETRSLHLPEDAVLSLSGITLPHIFVGDQAYPLTYIMKPHSRRTLEVKQYLITDCHVNDVLYRLFSLKVDLF